MSRIGVLVSLVTACLLGVAAIVVMQQPLSAAVGDEAERLLDFQAGSVTEVRIERAGGPTDRLRRHSGSDLWILERWTDGDTAQEPVRWAANPDRVRAGLRVLRELEDGGGRSRGSGPGGDSSAVRVAVQTGEGSPWRLYLGDGDGVGGRIEAASASPDGTSRRGRIERAVLDMFSPRSMLAWRHERVLPEVDGRIHRLQLESGERRVTLRRVGGRWRVIEPIDAVAHEPAVRAALGAFGGARVDRYRDSLSPEDEGTGLDRPGAAVVIERDRRVSEGGQMVTRTFRQRMNIGRMADAEGGRVLATVQAEEVLDGDGGSTPLWGPAVISVDADAFEKISPRVEVYLSRRAMETVEADVGEVRVSRPGGGEVLRLRRSLRGWEHEPSTSGTREEAEPMSAKEAQAIEGWLDLLTEPEAKAITLEEPDAWDHVADVELRSVEGIVLEELRIGELRPDDPEADRLPVVRNGRVWRVFEAEEIAEFVRAVAEGG